MWSCVLLTDPGSESVVFSGITLVPSDDPMALVDAVERLGAGHVVIAAPRALSGSLATSVSVAAGRWPQTRMSCLVSEHSPMAILSALALALAASNHPVLGVEAVHWFLRNAWSGAWASSVSRLATPSPSLGQHVRSLLPGGGFLIRQSPDPAVLSSPRAHDVGYQGMDRVLLVQEGAVPASITQRLSGAHGVREVRPVALPGSWGSVYGTARIGQVALMPLDSRPPIMNATHRCPVCQLDQVTMACPYCRVLAGPLSRVAVRGASA